MQVLHIDKVVHISIVMLSHVPSLKESHNRGRPAVLFTVKGIEVPIMFVEPGSHHSTESDSRQSFTGAVVWQGGPRADCDATPGSNHRTVQ